MDQILDLLAFLLPIYIANSSPVVLGGGTPLDLGLGLPDGRRLLGDGKTLRGFVGGVLAGTVAGGLIATVYLLPYFTDAQGQFIGAFALSLGALCGDALGSFIKRRVGIGAGKQFMPDTVIFLAIALIFVFPVSKVMLYDPLNLIFFFSLTIIMHPLSNAIANRFGLKKVPW